MAEEEMIIDKYGKEYMINLMLRDATCYSNGSMSLKQYDNFSIKTGQSWYLLRLFSLELFLKSIYLYHEDKPLCIHQYERIFRKLPPHTRGQILEKFNILHNEQHLQEFDTGEEDVIKNLKHFGEMFTKTRYYFGKYNEMSKVKIEERIGNMLSSYPEYDVEYRIEFLNNIIEAIKQQCNSDICFKLLRAGA